MRNPGLRLVGLTTSPSGGGVFGTRAEEELRHWLESRLDALGIDPVAYSRFVLSLLRRPPDSALSPLDEDIDFAGVNRPAGGGGAGAGGRRHHHRVRPRARISGDRDQRRAVVQCLTNAADQKCGVEPLVDELCAKLRNLEGSSGSTNDTSDTETEESKRKNLESRTIDHKEDKGTFGFAKSMERERDNDRESEMDKIKLQELQAKFDHSLEALWDSGPDYNLNWSDYGGDGPWNWRDLGNNLITIDNPKINSFYSSPHDDINLIIKQQRQQKEQQQYLSATNDYKEKLNNLKNEIDGNKIINNDGGNFVELKLKNEQEQKQEVEAKVIEVIEDKEQVRIEVKNNASENVKVEQSEVEEEEEDLLTSARTHFRPIKDDGNWVDGTTFPVNNNYESVNYRRSSCGNLLYLPNDDNPYMEYHETIIVPLSSSSASNTSTTAAAGDGTAVRNFTLKFRVKQCDKRHSSSFNCRPLAALRPLTL
ncbi:hypothetical protein G9C98_000882 [Cotesia typhae]|uniref:Uncharacterized protein n=1 Tax=Cotesia typhae TaxID=2053667 RepID=A0A8J5RFL9_9HYME|nr:hypothetical protein G9C98_000882 [Cotesia typhae]